MSKKNTKKATFIVDGKRVKHIEQYDKNGKKVWTKFKPIDNSLVNKGMHFIVGKPEQNHFDLMTNGQEIKKREYNQKIRPAGVLIYLGDKETKFITLPPIEVSKEEFYTQSDSEKINSYLKRVKLVNPNN